MFFRKVTSKSGGKEYAYIKLIENYREGNKIKQKVIANLGNLENFTPEKVQSLISGLSRICGIDHQNPSNLETEKVLHYGDVLALNKIWNYLHFSEQIAVHTKAITRRDDVPLLIKLLVINQIINPRDGKAVSDWYKNLYLPELGNKHLSCDDFYEAMDCLVKAKETLEKALFMQINTKNYTETDTVYCQLIKGYFERQSNDDNYNRHTFLNQSPERKQVDMAVLVTEEGIPLGHRTFDGFLNDGHTVPRRIVELQEHYGIEHCIYVGDQNIITEENLNLLHAYGYEYIVSIEYNRYNTENKTIQEELQKPADTFNKKYQDDLWYKEIVNGGIKYLLCYNPHKAARKQAAMDQKLTLIENELKHIKSWIRKKCDYDTKTIFYKATEILKDPYCKRHFNCEYDDQTQEFNYHRKQEFIDRENVLAGKFILKTNSSHLTASDIINAYNDYAGTRDEFKVIRNFNIRPTSQSSEPCVHGHVFVCILAHMVEKTLETDLRKKGLNLSARQALRVLEDIKMTINQLNGREVKSITRVTDRQQDIINALGLNQPPQDIDSRY